MKKSLILIMSLMLLVTVASSIAAQSTTRDHPASITSNEIRGDLNNNDEENFYSFVAGPGELTITVDVKANPGAQALLNFELLERNAATQILCCEYAQGNGGGTGRDVKSVKLAKRRVIILHTTNGPIGGGTFRVRLSGAAVSGLAAGQR